MIVALDSVRPTIVLARDMATAGESSELLRRTRSGELRKVQRGVYVSAAAWNALTRDDRYRLLVDAAAVSTENLVFSHESAAALWRLPLLDDPARRVHVVSEPARGGRSTTVLVRHTVGIPEQTVAIGGLRATTLARTVVDLAASLGFGAAVVCADAALRRTRHPVRGVPRTALSANELHDELSRVPVRHGSARAFRVIEFADGRADRPGESLSRVSMSLAGVTPPQLQVRLRGASGRVWTVDFRWPRFNVIGEFDGRFKYTDPEFMNGRTPRRVLFDEKEREDDLCAAGYGMSRWPWEKGALAARPAGAPRRGGRPLT